MIYGGASKANEVDREKGRKKGERRKEEGRKEGRKEEEEGKELGFPWGKLYGLIKPAVDQDGHVSPYHSRSPGFSFVREHKPGTSAKRETCARMIHRV